eukprot:gene4552-5149_t
MSNFTIFFVIAALIFRAKQAKGEADGEYELITSLFQRYDPTIVPVKNPQSAMNVKFDLALRSIIELNAKEQSLKSHIWVRIYWTDEFLTWNPKNYSNIDSIHVSPSTVWLPDFVLYNSVDTKVGANVYLTVSTRLIIKHDGTVTWFCPLIVTSSCPVHLSDYPFDSQICPLKFILWAHNSHRVNLSLVHHAGDLREYLSNGLFVMQRMPALRDVQYSPCCPRVPFVTLKYYIHIQRKTLFYLVHVLFPGLLLTLASFFSFLLTPESGERISLCITNLLALLFLQIMVSQHVPPISISIPIVQKFFITVIAVSAITLITSAISLNFLFDSGEGVDAVPWFVRVFINKYIARIIGMNRKDNNSNTCCHDSNRKSSKYAQRDANTQRDASSFHAQEKALQLTKRKTSRAVQDPTVPPQDSTATAWSGECDLPCRSDLNLMRAGLKLVVEQIKKNQDSSDYSAEWRFAIKVFDRFICIVLAIITVSVGFYLFLTVPKFYVK